MRPAATAVGEHCSCSQLWLSKRIEEVGCLAELHALSHLCGEGTCPVRLYFVHGERVNDYQSTSSLPVTPRGAASSSPSTKLENAVWQEVRRGVMVHSSSPYKTRFNESYGLRRPAVLLSERIGYLQIDVARRSWPHWKVNRWEALLDDTTHELPSASAERGVSDDAVSGQRWGGVEFSLVSRGCCASN
jgi:hypothetical protein